MKKHFIVFAALALVCLWLSCIFDNKENSGPLSMTCINGKIDTMSVFPTIQFVFSVPLIDSSVDFNFTPPISARYTVNLNATHDTVALNVMEMLEGNTKYVLRLKKAVTSSDGAVLDALQDSLVFVTYAREHEKNDTKDLADNLVSKIFGTISSVDDVDVFLCSNNTARGVYMQSINSQDSLYMVDSLSHVFSLEHPIGSKDTFAFSDSMIRPLYVVVVSRIRGSEGNYELGIVNK